MNKLLTFVAKIHRKNKRHSASELQLESVLKQGKDQFKQLIEKGLHIPVGLL